MSIVGKSQLHHETERSSADPVAPTPGRSTLKESHGEPLPAEVRGQFEASLGTDLSSVRVHQDAAQHAGARAYTVGQDIHFAPGQYDPRGKAGKELLAHEVAHTVQQRDASAPQVQQKADGGAPATNAAEADADQAAAAMVEGRPASVQPVREQAPHAKDDGSGWNALMNALRASLQRQDWADVAIRLNGLSTEDIAWYVREKMTYGQVAHVREAAVTAMPGYSQRVTDEIDKVDAGAARIAAAYAAYEAAVKKAKGGDASAWTEVANRLNGMGDWDIQDRLKRLDWFDLMAIRNATDNKRVITHVDKADAARVARIQAAYAQALATQDWPRVAQQLHGFDQDGLERSIREIADSEGGSKKLRYLKAAAIQLMPAFHQRVTSVIDAVAKEHGDEKVEPLPYVPTVEIPDVSDDTRALKGTDLASFGGNAKVAEFSRQLAAVHGKRKADREKKPENADANAKSQLEVLAASFASTGKLEADSGYYKTFAGFAKDWMSEMRERTDAQTNVDWYGKMRFPQKPTFDPTKLEDLVRGTSAPPQQVHPFVNRFIGALGEDFAPSTYKNHGGADWAPFCLDVKPTIARDDRGLYQRDQMMDFIERIHATVGRLGGDWAGIYNDTQLVTIANQRFGANRISYTGVDGTSNWHGALNLHIHLYLAPPSGDASSAPGSPRSAPKIDPDKE